MNEDFLAQKVFDTLGHDSHEEAVEFMSVFCEAFYEHKNLRQFVNAIEQIFATHSQLESFDIIFNNQYQCIFNANSFQKKLSISEQQNFDKIIENSIFNEMNARITNKLIDKICEKHETNENISLRFERGTDFYNILRDDLQIINENYAVIYDRVMYAEKNKLENDIKVTKHNKPIMKV